jgi:hypothetical protein
MLQKLWKLEYVEKFEFVVFFTKKFFVRFRQDCFKRKEKNIILQWKSKSKVVNPGLGGRVCVAELVFHVLCAEFNKSDTMFYSQVNN